MRKLLLLLLLPFLAACSTTDIKSTTETPGINLAGYKTYNFLDATARNEAAFDAPPGAIDALKQAVGRELQRRGYRQAATPDVWVNIGVVTEEKVQTRQTNFITDGAPQYIGQRNYHWKSEEVPVSTYAVGTATVELVDAARNEAVWQGVAASTLTKDPEKLTRRIDDAMAELFERFPVAPRH
ncbi:DUF4136 domain-containing protein [Hymenobacter sp. CRA2]|uniref:DUF4136 domain-containing protein n=1 Tax=Hymenobacter sp. CRA2 TaxID=1955620 RepID=UPI0009903316|nr:DUF4136 domain-containing protein [Hymenobacter sp. CRA2]OON68481.1 hypothetical protein B0919_12600 [Hymenobacter sp. CRA2]